MSGVEACKRRNEAIVEISGGTTGNSAGLVAQFKHLVENPFKAGGSEI